MTDPIHPPTEWDLWLDRLEQLAGHPLNGDLDRDGYSLLTCYELYKKGKRPLNALQIILWHKQTLGRHW